MSYNNTERTFKIGGHELKLRPMGSAAIYSYFEDKIRDEYWSTVKRATSLLEGEERMTFIADAMEAEPKGIKLSDSCMERMFSPSGIIEIVAYSIQHQNGLDNDERKAVCQAFDMNRDFDALRHLTGGLIDLSKKKKTTRKPKT